VTGVLEIARQALSDVRDVASSYRDMSLADEIATAKSMLEAAEIATEVGMDCDEALPPALDTVLATTLREGVTNILRHSKVQHCNIDASTRDGVVRLELGNDGVSDQRPMSWRRKAAGSATWPGGCPRSVAR